MKRLIGTDHPDYAASLNNLGRLLLEERKFREALPLLARSVNIYLAQRVDTHADLAFVFANRALALKGLGKDAEAEADFRRGLRAAETHDSRLIALILTDLADTLCAHGKVSRSPADAGPSRSNYAKAICGCAVALGLGREYPRSLPLAPARHIGRIADKSERAGGLKGVGAESLYGFEVEQRVRSIVEATRPATRPPNVSAGSQTDQPLMAGMGR